MLNQESLDYAYTTYEQCFPGWDRIEADDEMEGYESDMADLYDTSFENDSLAYLNARDAVEMLVEELYGPKRKVDPSVLRQSLLKLCDEYRLDTRTTGFIRDQYLNVVNI